MRFSVDKFGICLDSFPTCSNYSGALLKCSPSEILAGSASLVVYLDSQPDFFAEIFTSILSRRHTHESKFLSKSAAEKISAFTFAKL